MSIWPCTLLIGTGVFVLPTVTDLMLISGGTVAGSTVTLMFETSAAFASAVARAVICAWPGATAVTTPVV